MLVLKRMELAPLRPSEDGPSSVRSSVTDIPVAISPRHSTTVLHAEEPSLQKSTSFDSNRPRTYDDLDIEDPLSRVYGCDDGFEMFSRTEFTFISASCVGIVAVPLLYLLISQLQVLNFVNETN